MSRLEGGAPGAPGRSVLAYEAEEADAGLAELVEGSAVRQNSADGDVVETSFATDLFTLQRKLDEKNKAAERANRAALELQFELKAARREADALKQSIAAARPPGQVVQQPNRQSGIRGPTSTADRRVAVAETFSELARARTESVKNRQELEKERVAHRAEMVRARVQYQAAQEELQRLIKARMVQTGPMPGSQPAAARDGPAEEPASRWRSLAIGAAVAAALAVALPFAWTRMPRGNLGEARAPDVPDKPARVHAAPAAMPRAAPAGETPLFPTTPAGKAQFQNAVGRLNGLLASQKGRSPAAVLQEIHELYKDTDPTMCSFDWRNGQPALLYNGGHISLGQTIQRCADAVAAKR